MVRVDEDLGGQDNVISGYVDHYPVGTISGVIINEEIIHHEEREEHYTVPWTPPDIITKDYYEQFNERELAYIVNSGEITSDYVSIILKAKREDYIEAFGMYVLKDQSGAVKPSIYAGKYSQYSGKRTSLTSEEILAIPETYRTWDITDFAHAWNKDEYNMGHDKCIYIMKKLLIWNKSRWVSLTGYEGKGSRFMGEVGKNIGNLTAVITGAIGEIISGAIGGIFEGILGEGWKSKAIIIIVVIIIIIIAIILLVFWVKSRMLKKALGTGVGVAKQVM